jgi:hypothetical protein
MSEFKSTLNKGFQMTFDNGWTISVQFGYGNYCDNRNHPLKTKLHNEMIVNCPNAEIMMWDKDGNNHESTPMTHCTPDEVAGWIYKVSQFK